MNARSDAAILTRERLLDEALTLFSQRGYSATSIRDILQAARVTQPTLYYHFSDKQTLFQALIEKYYGDAHEQLTTIVKSFHTCRDRLRAFAMASFESCCSDPRVSRLMFQTYYGPTLPEIDGILDNMTSKRFRLVVQIMTEAIENREVAKSDPEFLALCYCSLIDQPINIFSRRSRPKRYLTPQLVDATLHVFFNGIQ